MGLFTFSCGCAIVACLLPSMKTVSLNGGHSWVIKTKVIVTVSFAIEPIVIITIARWIVDISQLLLWTWNDEKFSSLTSSLGMKLILLIFRLRKTRTLILVETWVGLLSYQVKLSRKENLLSFHATIGNGCTYMMGWLSCSPFMNPCWNGGRGFDISHTQNLHNEPCISTARHSFSALP